MKILIIGASGQVGSALADMLSNYNLVNVDRKNCDLRNLDNIRNINDDNGIWNEIVNHQNFIIRYDRFVDNLNASNNP